jgi:hypothetical protein
MMYGNIRGVTPQVPLSLRLATERSAVEELLRFSVIIPGQRNVS